MSFKLHSSSATVLSKFVSLTRSLPAGLDAAPCSVNSGLPELRQSGSASYGHRQASAP